MSEAQKILEKLEELQQEIKKKDIPKVLTQKDLVFYYDLSISFQAKYRSKAVSNRLPFSKNGGHIAYNRDEIEAWLLS